MRPFPWIALLIISALPVLGKAQVYIGLGGGGGIPHEVLFRAAVPLEISLRENISIQTGAAFVQRENTEVLVNLSRSRNYLRPVINYLELPVLLKMNLPFEIFDFYGFIGPKVAYGVQLNSTYREDNRLFQEHLNFKESNISRFDAGLSLGVGIEKKISRGNKLFIDFRHYLGFFNINTGEGEDIFNGGKAFTIGFMIAL